MQVASPTPAVCRPVIWVTVAMLGVLPFAPLAASAPTRAEANRPAGAETLQQRAQELEALRAEQKKALENEARLKREIEAIGDDRRKFNQQIIDTAARVVSLEEKIAKTKERMAALDD